MGRYKRGWYERTEIPKISLDWVNINCKNITDRERRLLEIINDRKLVRRDHLEIIHEGYRDLNMRTNVLNRSINKLFLKMCIDKVHEEQEYLKGNTPAILSLDRAGAILLDVPFKRRIQHEQKNIGDKIITYRHIPSNFKHIHGINQLEVETLEYCLEKGYELVRWDLEDLNPISFIYNNEKITVIPDVVCIINKKGNPILFLIEYDTGTEDFRYKTGFPTLVGKIKKYRLLKYSNAWRETWWAKAIKTPFPPIFFVTEDNKRINHIDKKFKEFQISAMVGLSKSYRKMLEHLLS